MDDRPRLSPREWSAVRLGKRFAPFAMLVSLAIGITFILLWRLGYISPEEWLSPEEWTAVRLSVRVATVAMLVSLPIGIATAYVLARCKFIGKSVVDGIVLLPLILPPVVTGYLLLLTFGRRGLAGSFLEHIGIVFSFRWTGAALACGVMGFPLMVRAIRLSIETVDRRLEEAAGTLGASPSRVFVFVTFPLIAPGIIAGMILSFAKAMGEFGATITFVSNIPGETQTLPSAIYTFTQIPGGEGGALRLTLVSVAISMAALIVSELMARWVGRKIWTE
jgi:molybdate transport system permease protein